MSKGILVGEVMIVPTKKICKCGRKCVDYASNGLDPYIVCSRCLTDVCTCRKLRKK